MNDRLNYPNPYVNLLKQHQVNAPYNDTVSGFSEYRLGQVAIYDVNTELRLEWVRRGRRSQH